MRAIDLKLMSEVFHVISSDTIRKHIVKAISLRSIKGENGNTQDVVIIEVAEELALSAKPNSSLFVSYKYGSIKVFTTLNHAQKHQLRRRKREQLNLLSEFKKARKEYEDYKLKYKNLPASNPE